MVGHRNFSLFLPCYIIYSFQNAEAVGESCCLCGLLYFVPLVNIAALIQIRGKVRDTAGIPGGCCEDLLMILFCHLCALVQEAQEVQDPSSMSIMRQ
jgi:Cys-rich protein (TIGR01571 family)